MEPIRDILQLRRYLAERHPNLRLCTGQSLQRRAACWPTGVAKLDHVLNGGLPKSAITELVSPGHSAGSALLRFALLHQAHHCRQWVALVDAHDSFDPAALSGEVFPRFIWIRGRGALEALKATDLLLRDGNLSLVLLELRLNSPAESRRISATTWHRFQRLIKPLSTALLVITPVPLISGPCLRLQIDTQFPLAALDQPEPDLLRHLHPCLAHEEFEPSAEDAEPLATAG